MIRTLVAELGAVPGVEVVTVRAPGFPPLRVAGVTVLPPSGNFAETYRAALAGVDAAWPTAPETDGALESLGRLTHAAGVGLLGCEPEAVQLAARKSRTSAALAAAGVPVVPTFVGAAGVNPLPGPWVVKPDDGAGAQGVRILPDWRAASLALSESDGHAVAQPWLRGEPRSLSLLCAGREATVLSVNRQHVEVRDTRVILAGLSVNIEPAAALRDLASAIASAIPGLWGYVGVDYLQTEIGPCVLEVNPRLTTSYCGLSAALGFNVAESVLDLARTGKLPPPDRPGSRVVDLLLEPHHA
jgi:predicted ATP-grasp superfamily ATP-dependent carboligase